MQGALPFGGRTYSPAADRDRLETLMHSVYRVMRDGRWRTLAEIRSEIGRGSEAGISARLRDLRKPEFRAVFPCAAVERRRRGDPKAGVWEYRLEREGGK